MPSLPTFTCALLVGLASAALASAKAEPATVTLAPRTAATAVLPTSGTTALPLTAYNVPYSSIPYQMNPYPVGRGPQSGYNVCNSTTEGATSLCQTMFINDAGDFCLWSTPDSDSTIGDEEAAVVAYCTQPGYGTRVIPAGTITGLQFMRTSAYIQVVGRLNQANIGLQSTDTGGELDPHGADLLGNPIGGLVFSNATDNTSQPYTQVNNWNQFIGSGIFCLKACFNSVTSPDYCQNTFDLIGCSYNAPAAYTDGVFESCEGDLQDPAGIYTSDGQTYTWSQPTSLPATSTLPWTPRIPASSNCVTYQSADLFAAAGTAAAAVSTSGSAAAATGASSSVSMSVVTITSGTSTATAGAAASRSTTASSSAAKTSATTSASTGSRASASSTVWQAVGSLGVAAFTVWALI